MDTAVAIVQAYLRLNGCFTVSEYPVVAAMRGGEYRAATDLDILAFRFPHAGRLVPGPARRGQADEDYFAPDPVLGLPAEQADMIVGEVKEGRATLNAAARDPGVLRAVLVGFGCCSRAQAPGVVERLIRDGEASLPIGHRIRLVAFGCVTEGARPERHAVVDLAHVIAFLREYLREHWEVLRHAEAKDPALGFLSVIEKATRGNA